MMKQELCIRRLSFDTWVDESQGAPVGSSSVGFNTPTRNSSIPPMYSSFKPICADGMKPVVGMPFDSIEDVEEFYREYAYKGRFSVRGGSRNLSIDGQIANKRFLCSRNGYNKSSDDKTDAPTKNKKKRAVKRCGCDAYIYVKLGADKKYYISSLVEEHNHALASPDKAPFLHSNRVVSQRAKNTLFTCHKASIGTSQAYRLLQVTDGGFSTIGCTKRDLQNYYRGLREKIKNGDAQLFIAQLERKKEANSAFFYDFVVDDEGKLVYVFWADATSRKNYNHFGDLVSFDATYSTNIYDMKFTPFTGVNHHMQSVFFGAGFLLNEKIESYEWLFRTFLLAMGGKAPSLIVTDEDASMKAAIASIFPDTVHRLCMWHILEKIPEKIGHATSNDNDFWPILNDCVWGSENGDEFETRWNAFISKYGLERNVWMANRESVYDEGGILLDEKPVDANEVEEKKKIAMVRNKVEDLIQHAKGSKEGIDLLVSSVMNMEASLGSIVLKTVPSRQQEYEGFIGCQIPEQIHIHPPTDVRSKGRCKRIKKSKELPKPRKRKNSNEQQPN